MAEPVKPSLAAALRYSSSFDVIGAASCATALTAAKSDRVVKIARRVARILVWFIVPSSDWRPDGCCVESVPRAVASVGATINGQGSHARYRSRYRLKRGA